ncbi:tyrosine-type recombinase/integrase [Arthrobacter sp. ISL-95]|uniref:tyrosine-type recombinase/integrase n=1 Tax=Arthrobacter sp. ISL-95 TaxID=2819116 RepID=UPI001BE63862|nr:tyrosine-type recombinase/integrase [Arthrobacter sp. ISL-95]MBT2586492.1 tyrosine-type recombinase/integrase [Arthrobacter sp. ISL-95]
MTETATAPKSPSGIAAAATYRRGRELRLPPDSALTTLNRAWPRQAFDGGTPAPEGQDKQILRLQSLGVDEAIEWARESTLKYGLSPKSSRRRIAAVRHVLRWLHTFPRTTWEERWLASGMDEAPREGLKDLSGRLSLGHAYLSSGVSALVRARLVRPSYEWMFSSKNWNQSRGSLSFLEVAEPLETARLRALPEYQRGHELTRRNAENAIARILVRMGKRIAQLTGDDVLAYSHIARSSRHAKEHLAWELLVALGPLSGEPPTLRAAWHASVASRRHTVKTLVDRYRIPESGVRRLLIDYLEELKPSMDYGSLEGIAYRLVRLFWAEVIDINPEQQDLRLSAEVAAQWRERVHRTLEGRPRGDTASTYFAVRALYQDIAEWSHDQPERWAIWVAPTPFPRTESRSVSKQRNHVQARMQQRTRSLTPLMPAFIRSAAALRERGARLLTATTAAAHGETYTVDGVTYRRHDPPDTKLSNTRARIWAHVVAAEAGSIPPAAVGKRADITAVEADGFWGWAVASTFKETGIRLEELQELTQLSLRHYVAPTTNTVVPLLHIVPSKTDQERLVPMSPELVKVLVDVQRRARGTGQTVPLSVRYDTNEKTFSDPLPHLFARLVGPTQNVLSHTYISRVLNAIATHAALEDAGMPVTFTPHDFRRLFATELVGTGLPLHIVSTLLGHLSLETTRGYTAVFPEHVIQAHRAFIERRRQTRPDDEHRPASAEEWREFEEHFLLRRIALGTCHRPYATPCVHEHACVKCRFLQVDPAQTGRLDTMTENAEQRLIEAREHQWLGEVSSLEESLVHLRRRRQEAARNPSERVECP